jgi:AraC-like DNA-binding protein
MNGRPLPEGFDTRLALRKLENYCRAAGLPAHLIDADGAVIGAFDAGGRALAFPGHAAQEAGAPSGAPVGAARDAASGAVSGAAREAAGKHVGCCPVCAALGAEEVEEELRAQLFVAYQAERFGGKYMQLCPHSLLFWAAPIVSDGIMRAALIGGPVMVVDAGEVYEELRAAGKLPPGGEEALRAALESAPRVLPQRASSLAELLSDVASALTTPSPLEPEREREEQQSRISEYIHDMKEGIDTEAVSHPYPIEKERELLLAISRGDKRESQRLLNEILGFIFFSTGRDAPVIKARVLELVVLLSRAALEGGADMEQIFGLNFTYLNQVNKMRSVDDIAFWLSKIMARFTDLVFTLKDVKHAEVMQRALKYINSHYTEEITLDDVASSVYLSPTYFSKLFSEEMGCRFTAYLNKVRIGKSKLLLKGSALPIVDIAGLVGYEDQSYFTKVFKRVTGVSPGKFRESGGRASASSQEIHDSETGALPGPGGAAGES